ncbi:MAG: aldo/keto reductase [Polyangiaceae bacterium]|nr:aldo/keto reductase [Polyangiaceae bacterium]
MRKRALGNTGVEVTELALGTWGLSGDGYGAVVAAEVDRVIDAALSHGIELFDTADVYAKGAIETKLGERIPKGKGFVVTKIGTDLAAQPIRKRFDPSFLEESLDRSAERLKRPLDIVLLHNPTQAALEKAECVGFMREQKNIGKMRLWGVSAGSADVARTAIEQGAEVVELAYNLTLPGDLHAIAGEASQRGTGILARSVLAYGLLAGHWTQDREFYPGDHRADRWTREELRIRVSQLEGLREVASKYVLTLRAAALRFALANDLVSSAVLGPRSVAQLEQLIREAGSEPPYLRDTMLVELSAKLEAAGIKL